jgi:hypothetical protein
MPLGGVVEVRRIYFMPLILENPDEMPVPLAILCDGYEGAVRLILNDVNDSGLEMHWSESEHYEAAIDFYRSIVTLKKTIYKEYDDEFEVPELPHMLIRMAVNLNIADELTVPYDDEE